MVSCVLLEAMPQTRLNRSWMLVGSKATWIKRVTGAGGPKFWKSRWYEEPKSRPPSEADVHIEGMETPGVWRHGRLVVAGTDAIEKTTHLRNLQGWHPDRGPGGALPVDARVPDYANKLGCDRQVCCHLRTCLPVCSQSPLSDR